MRVLAVILSALLVLYFAALVGKTANQHPNQPAAASIIQTIKDHPVEAGAGAVGLLTTAVALFPEDVGATAPAIGSGTEEEIAAVSLWVRAHLGDLTDQYLGKVEQILSEIGR